MTVSPAQPLDAPPDYIHAHAPSGYRGYLPGSGEPRGQDQREDLSFREPGGLVDQALFDGAGAHRVHVQAASVVADPDQHVCAGVPRRKVNGSAGTFARRDADFGPLDTVVHAVADQVNQRIVQLVDDGLIQFRIRTLDGQVHLLVQIDPEIVNQPAEPFEGGFERQHADAHRVFAERRRQAVDGFGYIPDVRIVPGAGDLAETCLHGHQFAHEVNQLIQLVGRNANARPGSRTGRQAPVLDVQPGRQYRRRTGFRRLVRHAFDGELAIVLDEHEDIAYGLRRRRRT